MKASTFVALLLTTSIVVVGSLSFFNQKNTLTFGEPDTVEIIDGKKVGNEKFEAFMAERGIHVKYKIIPANEMKAGLERLITDPEIDVVLNAFSAGPIPDDISKKFSSLGATGKFGLIFLVKTGDKRIKRISDLVGKKILIWSTPEGNLKPAFTSADAVASIYSGDFVLEQVFSLAGVNVKNSRIINAWPNEILSVKDWDVIITGGIPTVTNNAKGAYAGIFNKLITKNIELAEIGDLEAVSRKLPFLTKSMYPSSGIDFKTGIPDKAIPILTYVRSTIVRAEIDPGIALSLAAWTSRLKSVSGMLVDKGEFPNFPDTDKIQHNDIAKSYYKDGLPFLSRYFSPIFATALSKLLYILIPLLTIAWPLSRLIPTAYGFYVKHRINHWYHEFTILENKTTLTNDAAKASALDRLKVIDAEINNLRFPFLHSHFVQEVFIAREHVELTRLKIINAPLKI